MFHLCSFSCLLLNSSGAAQINNKKKVVRKVEIALPGNECSESPAVLLAKETIQTKPSEFPETETSAQKHWWHYSSGKCYKRADCIWPVLPLCNEGTFSISIVQELLWIRRNDREGDGIMLFVKEQQPFGCL